MVHSAQGYRRTRHNWANLRSCAEIGGMFLLGNGVSRFWQRGKKICDSRVFAIWRRRFCAKKVNGSWFIVHCSLLPRWADLGFGGVFC